MANMFWNLDKISETTAIHSGFRLCPIISHSSIRQTMTNQDTIQHDNSF